jgi:histidinol dehydrogenase
VEIGSVADHRRREGGALVYPVYSRRSRGLSVGINLFPDRKVCSFDCPYCEVFPFGTDLRFSTEIMAEALVPVLRGAAERGTAVRDICFSGNGEPTMSPHFTEALEAAARIRRELVPRSALVLITNGTGLLREDMFEFLRRAAGGPLGLNIWLKLDAGTEDWYAQMDRSAVPFPRLTAGIRDFAAAAPVTIQTMLCAVGGKAPPPEEAAAWTALVADLALAADRGAAIPPQSGNPRPPALMGVQLYGKARPAPEDPLAEALPPAFLEERAALLRSALAALPGERRPVPVEVFP